MADVIFGSSAGVASVCVILAFIFFWALFVLSRVASWMLARRQRRGQEKQAFVLHVRRVAEKQ